VARQKREKHNFGGYATDWHDATPQRQHRVAEVIAPLLVQGLSAAEISRRTGITREVVRRDMQLCRSMWVQRHDNARDEWRGRLLAQYEWLMAECAQAWEDSKAGRVTTITHPDGSTMTRREPSDPRWLSGLLQISKEASVYLGLREGADAVSRVEVPETTRQALAPMTSDSYLALVANGGLAAINAVPPVDRREYELPAPAAPVTVTITPEPEPVAEDSPPAQRSVRHPRG
jgi:hypothetical protein